MVAQEQITPKQTVCLAELFGWRNSCHIWWALDLLDAASGCVVHFLYIFQHHQTTTVCKLGRHAIDEHQMKVGTAVPADHRVPTFKVIIAVGGGCICEAAIMFRILVL